MNTLQLFAMYVGFFMMAMIAFINLVILKDLAIGFARAVSITRFYMATSKMNNLTLPWRAFPKFFIRQWWRLTGDLPVISGPGGYWRGVGDWESFRQGERQ